MSINNISDSTGELLNNFNLDKAITIPEVDQSTLDLIKLNDEGQIINVDSIIKINDDEFNEIFSRYNWNPEEIERIQKEAELSISEDDVHQKFKEDYGELPQLDETCENFNEEKEKIEKQIIHEKNIISQLNYLFEDVKKNNEDLTSHHKIRYDEIEKINKEKSEIEGQIHRINDEIANTSSIIEELGEYKSSETDNDSYDKIEHNYQQILDIIPSLNNLIKSKKDRIKIENDDVIETLKQIKQNTEDIINSY